VSKFFATRVPKAFRQQGAGHSMVERVTVARSEGRSASISEAREPR
jgi:hypothetical protein